MRYRIFLTILFSVLIAESGISQETQQSTLKQEVIPAISDTIDQDLKVPTPGVEDSTKTWDFVYYGMPIAKPCCLDAKMKYWWPSEEYHYNMPNAYPGKRSPYRLKYQK